MTYPAKEDVRDDAGLQPPEEGDGSKWGEKEDEGGKEGGCVGKTQHEMAAVEDHQEANSPGLDSQEESLSISTTTDSRRSPGSQ